MEETTQMKGSGPGPWPGLGMSNSACGAVYFVLLLMYC